MKVEDFDSYCASLPATEMVVQWGGAHVWKVGGKVFALASKWGKGNDTFKIGFKASDMAFRMLTEEPGIAPLPYLGRYKWVQVQHEDALGDRDVEGYIQLAHEMVAAKLTKAKRRELGLTS
ncbi:MAG: MmcQ/YjbR family DNA-binding protein [Rhizobiaceae bacterium]